MNWKKMILVGIGTVLLGAGLGAPAVAATTGSGAELFAEYKCSMCHSIASADIEAKVKSEKMKGPDLGGYANERETAELLSFLTQESEPDGKKHKKKFPGGEQELEAILAWFAELKAAE